MITSLNHPKDNPGDFTIQFQSVGYNVLLEVQMDISTTTKYNPQNINMVFVLFFSIDRRTGNFTRSWTAGRRTYTIFSPGVLYMIDSIK